MNIASDIEEHTEILRSLIGATAKTNGVAFDLGTGVGRIVSMLSEEGFSVYGCEVDPERSGKANRIDRARVDVANALSWDPPGQADVVTCIELFEHLYPQDQVRLLNRIRGWLAPDGKLILSTPQRHSLISLVERAYCFAMRHTYCWWDPEHVSILRRSELEKLLQDNGFKIIHRIGFHLVPDLIAARIPRLKRFQRRAHHGMWRNLAFDQIYVATRVKL
jgi:2-polyprenyl-3-methyl-5-hydroxy-6-metoxy-1,4-benzoquinol methylase